MKRLLWLLSVALALPATGSAATANTSCNSLFTGSELAKGKAQCIYMCSTIVSATTTNCPTVKVPFNKIKHAEIRVYAPGSTNCGFDDGWVVGAMSSTEATTTGHRAVYGVLDDDAPAAAPGNTVGVVIPYPMDPYLAVVGLVSSGASCDNNPAGVDVLDVLGIFWEDSE